MKPAQRAAIAKAKQLRLLQTIERYDRYGKQTSKLGAWYQIIPIPTADTMEPVAFRLWVLGHATTEHPNLEAARRAMKERVRRDDMKVKVQGEHDQRIPF